MSIRKLGLAVVIILATITTAYVLGIQAGNLLGRYSSKQSRMARQRFTNRLLEQMNSIKVGDTMPDVLLQNLDREWVRLSTLAKRRTVITFIDYNCDNCLDEIEALVRVVDDSADYDHFVFVSASNPLDLLSLREHYRLHSQILYDENHEFQSSLNLVTYPFNVVVDSSFIIRKIIAGRLVDEDLRSVTVSADES